MKNAYQSKVLDHLGLVAGMYEELEIGEIIDQAIEQDRGLRNVSIGQAVRAMVLNGLGFVNKQLYLVPMFFADKPVERLVGDGICAAHLNDDVLGRSLDALYAFGVTDLYALLSGHACVKLGLAARVGHVDSSSFHTDGMYNSATGPEEGVIHITQGYSRDHRPDLNQVVVDLMVEHQAGIPLLMKPLSGNSSDKRDFAPFIEAHIAQLREAHGLEYIVADSALYTEENLQRFGNAVKWISRVPETIKEAKDAISQVNLDTMTRLNDDYHYQMLTSTYAQVPQRWMLVYSEPARQRGKHTIIKRLLTQSEQEMRAFQKLCRQEFACAPDAEQALEAFQKTTNVSTVVAGTIRPVPRYTSPGRPGKARKPDTLVFQIEGRLSVSVKTYHERLKQKSCFIVATNEVDETRLSNEDLLPTYKGQSQAEKGFKFLKDPVFLASSLYLKKPERIMALLMVMTLCLLVYTALEYRIRHALSRQGKTFPHQTGKAIQNPTARWIFQCFVGIHVLIIRQTQEMVLNLNDQHRVIITLLGDRYQFFYS
jgi:transposase